jgi:hypothetical protein
MDSARLIQQLLTQCGKLFRLGPDSRDTTRRFPVRVASAHCSPWLGATTLSTRHLPRLPCIRLRLSIEYPSLHRSPHSRESVGDSSEFDSSLPWRRAGLTNPLPASTAHIAAARSAWADCFCANPTGPRREFFRQPADSHRTRIDHITAHRSTRKPLKRIDGPIYVMKYGVRWSDLDRKGDACSNCARVPDVAQRGTRLDVPRAATPHEEGLNRTGSFSLRRVRQMRIAPDRWSAVPLPGGC